MKSTAPTAPAAMADPHAIVGEPGVTVSVSSRTCIEWDCQRNDAGTNSVNDLYSVYALTDGDGNVVERYWYDPYGKVTVLAPDGTTVRPESLYGNRHTFTGRTEDRETGLLYFRNRMYETGLGRFVSRDPLGYVDGYGLQGAYFVPGGVDPFGWDRGEVDFDDVNHPPIRTPVHESWEEYVMKDHNGCCFVTVHGFEGKREGWGRPA